MKRFGAILAVFLTLWSFGSPSFALAQGRYGGRGGERGGGRFEGRGGYGGGGFGQGRFGGPRAGRFGGDNGGYRGARGFEGPRGGGRSGGGRFGGGYERAPYGGTAFGRGGYGRDEGGFAPPGRAFGRGQFLPRGYAGREIANPGRYHLRRPPNGYGWVSVGPNIYLTQRSTGLILDTVPGGP